MTGHAWTDVEYLLALLADRLAENTFSTARSLGNRKVRRPKPVPRPGEERHNRLGDRGEHDPAEVVAYLDQYKPAS